ncbi:MAG: aminopeptidase [Phototrophicaceae bacterium]
MSEFAEKIQKYADVAVHVGLDFKAGQRLWITASLEARELAIALTRSAYKAGAEDVFVSWTEPELDQIRLREGSDVAVEAYPQWVVDGLLNHTDEGHARISISCADPDFFGDEDADRLQKMQRSRAIKTAPVSDRVVKNVANWLIVMSPHPAISAKLFPELSAEDARRKHWETIFTMCRIEGADPVQDWVDHIANLTKRAQYLTQKKYHALHYQSPITDLTIGLPDNHLWETARLTMSNGTKPVVNIPTEEVFTLAHRERITGVVKSTKPLSWNGTIIENFTLQFSEGDVVSAKAERGQSALDTLLSTDDGARSIGEVALVPHSSPISQSDLLFFNTLYDENASNHLALGRAYRFTMENGTSMSDDDFAEAGGNNSLVHVDFMMGSGDMNIDGINADGTRDPIFRNGEWAFEVS